VGKPTIVGNNFSDKAREIGINQTIKELLGARGEFIG
jgi:hypothetical protein